MLPRMRGVAFMFASCEKRRLEINWKPANSDGGGARDGEGNLLASHRAN